MIFRRWRLWNNRMDIPPAYSGFAGSNLSCFQIASLGWWHGWDCLTLIWNDMAQGFMVQRMDALLHGTPFFPPWCAESNVPTVEFPGIPQQKARLHPSYYRNVGWTNILLCYLCPFFHTLSEDFSIMFLTWAAKIWKTYILQQYSTHIFDFMTYTSFLKCIWN